MKLNSFLTDKRTFAPDGAPNPSATPAVTPVPDGNPPADPGPDLSFIPSDYHVDGKPDLGKFTEHYQDMVAREAQQSERLKEVPEDGQYDYALPADFSFGDLDLPEGFAVQVSDDPAIAPLLGELGGILKDLGAPKLAGQKIAGLIAKYEATKFSQAFAAHKAELASLGTPSQQEARMAALERSMAARLPAELASAMHIRNASSAQIKALETLLAPRSPQVPPARPAGINMDGMSALDILKHANAQTAKA